MRKISLNLACTGVIVVFAACYIQVGRGVAEPLPAEAAVVGNSVITIVEGAEAEPPLWPTNIPVQEKPPAVSVQSSPALPQNSPNDVTFVKMKTGVTEMIVWDR